MPIALRLALEINRFPRWVWPVILIPLIYFAPESPWWLVRKNRLDDARAALVRLTSDSKDDVPFDFDKNIALMVATTEHERAVNASTTYMACFQGANLRRTVIAVGVYCIQVLNGNPLRGYSTYFLQQAGMATTQSFNMTIVGFAVAIIGGFFSVSLMACFGEPVCPVTDVFQVGLTSAFWSSYDLRLECCKYARHHDHYRSARSAAS